MLLQSIGGAGKTALLLNVHILNFKANSLLPSKKPINSYVSKAIIGHYVVPPN